MKEIYKTKMMELTVNLNDIENKELELLNELEKLKLEKENIKKSIQESKILHINTYMEELKQEIIKDLQIVEDVKLGHFDNIFNTFNEDIKKLVLSSDNVENINYSSISNTNNIHLELQDLTEDKIDIENKENIVDTVDVETNEDKVDIVDNEQVTNENNDTVLNTIIDSSTNEPMAYVTPEMLSKLNEMSDVSIVEELELPKYNETIEIQENVTSDNSIVPQNNVVVDIIKQYDDKLDSSFKDVYVSNLINYAHNSNMQNVNSDIHKDMDIVYNSKKDYYDGLIQEAVNIQKVFPNILLESINTIDTYDFQSSKLTNVKNWYNEHMKEFMQKFSKLSSIERLIIVYNVAQVFNATVNNDITMYEIPITNSNIELNKIKLDNFTSIIKTIPIFLSIYISATEYKPLNIDDTYIKVSTLDLTYDKLNIKELKDKLGIKIEDIDISFEKEFRCFENYDAPYIQYVLQMIISNSKQDN